MGSAVETIASSTTDDDAPAAVPQRNFYIFGHNIQHSLSPALHNAGFRACGLPHVYSIHESPSVDASVEAILARPDFGGASVTFPHKLQVGRVLDSLAPAAEKVGAVNTIVVREPEGGGGGGGGGRRQLVGDNTDWLGIGRCVRKSGVLSSSSSSPSGQHPSLTSRPPALVLGAGGAARAACHALQEDGWAAITVVNRTRATAERMARGFPGVDFRVHETLEAAACAGIDGAFRVVVACIPADDLGEDEIPAALFAGAESGVLIEMAYRPLVTGMMRVAGAHAGWKVYRGVDVLEEQAYSQFELWTGRPAPVKEMREAMLAKMR